MKTVNLYRAQLITGFMVILLLLLSGCGNRFEEELTNEKKRAKNSLSYLKDQIDRKQLSNVLLINKYADFIASKKPTYKDVALLLKKEATSEGKAYQGLVKRLNEINLQPTSEAMAEANLNEIQLIAIAAEETEFNNSLADVVNTLASFSDGELAVVNVPASNRTAAKKTNALVGNPSYGSWQRGSDGRSFWEWYGMYSMFSNVMGGNRYYYDSWSSRPHYSYYNQYGRNRWGSSYDVNRNYDLSRSSPSKYNKPSSATRTRYATSSTRSSRYGSSSSRSASGSSKSSNKSSSRSSTYGSRSSSAYGSSSRSSSSSSSRSYRSGK
ncbi:MAG TPA: hypothetical protein ENJ08_08535 [Gammaproteobacteria bacterium]|nr:hypothetical protein [Gammaproteobacteria bacterium]